MHDVVIIGAGPVGQTAALLLARWGVNVLVIDQRAQRDIRGSKAICQQRDVLDIWDLIGAADPMLRKGTTWSTARTFLGLSELFSVEHQGSEHELPAWINLSQSFTEQVLDELISANPRVHIEWGREVSGIDQSEHSATLSLADGGTVQASWVLGCAGASSEGLRQQLGIEFPGTSFGERFLICDIQANLGDWAHERRFYFDPPWNPGRQVLVHACPDSTYRIDWQVPDDYVASEADRIARVQQVIGDASFEIRWHSIYRFDQRIADRFRVGRVLLLGDMAHLVSPFGARGLNSGVCDAENAAWKIAHVLKGWSDESLLDTYESERRAAAIENNEVTTATMRFLAPSTEDELARRNTLLDRARHDTSVHSQIDSGRMAEPFWYTDSSIVQTDPTRPWLGRPQRGHRPLPAPGVLLPDANLNGRRLRMIARDGLLAVVSPELADSGVKLVTSALKQSYPGHSTVVLADAIQHPDGSFGDVLRLRAGEVWLVRPDAYVAAVLTRPTTQDIVSSVRMTLGS